MFYREKSGLAEVRQAMWLAFLSPVELAYPDRDHVVAESVEPRCGGELKCVEQTNVLLFVREVRNDILGEPLSACQHGELEQSPRVVVHCKCKRPEAPHRISRRDLRRLYICRSCLPALRQATPWPEDALKKVELAKGAMPVVLSRSRGALWTHSMPKHHAAKRCRSDQY